MSTLEDYANKYQSVRMERRDGILQMTLHTEGQSLRWGFGPHGELPEAFHDVGADRDNRVVILTGTGAEFSGPRATPGTSSFPSRPPAERIDRIHWEGRHLLMRLLLGLHRGRYYLLPGQTLDAQKALEFGLVAEVLPPDRLLARAWELAEGLTKKPTLVLR